MTNPIQSMRLRLRGSVMAHKVHFVLTVLHIVVPLAVIETILLVEGATIRDSLILLVPLMCLGAIPLIILIRGLVKSR